MTAKDVFGSRTTSFRAAIAAAAFAAAAMPAQARSLVHYFDFDTPSGSGLAYAGVDRGISPADFTLRGSSVPRTVGAMGSDSAYCASAANTALWLGDGSRSLGCGTTQGFTISFWLKASASHGAWTDFFGFRVGGLDYRCEYVSGSGGDFTLFYNAANVATCAAFGLETEGNVNISATAGVWRHVAFVFTPNGINPTGTCMIYLGGEKVARMAVGKAGDLQQLHVGSWVRALNGGDRKTSATNTGIDELAVFDYPATAEQVKWLAKYRPAQPAKGPGRASRGAREWNAESGAWTDKATATKASRDGVQLWEGGPYWADRNIGASSPEDYGLYFWWGDTVGYRPSGTTFGFSFSPSNCRTYHKPAATLQSEGWITADGVLAPSHDAAHVHWGGCWRMPTHQELHDLCYSKCDWTWTTLNGVNGYIVRGRGAYASNSIFLPATGDGYETLLFNAGSYGYYWSSVPGPDYGGYACSLYFNSGRRNTNYYYYYYYDYRYYGQSVRPVRGSAK